MIKYVKPQYLPYSIMRKRLRRFFFEYLSKAKEDAVVVCDQRLSLWIHKKNIRIQTLVLSKDKIDGTTSVHDMQFYLQKNIDTCIEKLIFALPFTDNLSVLSRVYCFDSSWNVEDIYDVLDQNGIHTCYSDICVSDDDGKADIKNDLRQICQYYETYSSMVRKALYKLNRSGKCPWFLEVFCSKKRYQIYNDEFHLKKYIAELLFTKDFRLFFEETKKVSGKIKWLLQIESDVKEMLGELKADIEKRQADAIVWNFVDNVSYHKMVRDMPWLNNAKDQSINFSNTFSQMPWTSWTFKAIFSGKHVIQDKMFEFGKVGENSGEYKYYDELCNRGYKVLFLGRKENRQNMDIPWECKYGLDAIHEVYNYSTEKQWRAITLLAEKDTKLFLLIHNFCESHTPFINPELENIEGFSFGDAQVSERQKTLSRKYLDKELNWYHDYYGNAVCVYMSDHGDKDHEPLSAMNYSDERTHLLFFIQSPGKKVMECSSLISVKDEMNVLFNVIDGGDVEEDTADYVTIECYDSYSKRFVDNVIERISDFDYGEWMQFQAYRSSKEKYVLFNNGEQRYFLLPDEMTDYSETPEYQGRIDELRKLLEPTMVDVHKYSFFSESERLYNKLGI